MAGTTVAPITPEDLEDPKEYEKVRRDRLTEMYRYKMARRMSLADDVSLLWEDRRTLQHQIQEMVHMEDVEDADAVREVFHHYEDLMPNGEDLIATLFIEVKESADIRPRLHHYARIAESLRLVIGDLAIKPQLQGDHGTDEAATAVTYLRFAVPRDAQTRIDEAILSVDHPHLQGVFPLPDTARIVPI